MAASPFPPPGTYRYSASVSGQVVGAWSVTIKVAGDGTQLDENSSATFAGMQLSATASLLLGPDLSPSRYTGRYGAPGRSQVVRVDLTATSARLAGIGASARTLALEPNTRHFVVIEPALLAGLFALPAQFQAWGDPSVTWIAPITGQGQVLSKDQAARAPRPTDVPAQDVNLSVQGQIPFTIWYDPGTLVPDEVIVASQKAVLTRVRP